MQLADDGTVIDVRLALGGVAHKPWRAWAAETALRGATASESSFRAAAEAELREARGLRHNAFKIELANRLIVSCLLDLSRGASL
jgi:xanthine dehydrogenase YagS FAD-binding subunit